MTLSVLIVDDDATVRDTLADFFDSLGHTARSVGTATEGRRAVAEHTPDVVLVDLQLPDAHGTQLIEALRADDPELAIIVLTGHADVDTAVRAMRLGAADLLEKPVKLELLGDAVHRAAEGVRMRRELTHLRTHTEADATIWAPPSIERLIDLAARNADVPVLLLGESGTGKGLVARRIHDRSPRATGAFVAVNCASLTPALFETELFGHERGAFTDARSAKRGLLEVAAGGTLLLDEIGDLASSAQPKLLTAIEDGLFRRVGGTAQLRSDARIIAATNAPLREAVAAGRFRSDLFYRLQVLTIELAPLRERRNEIATLADTFLPRGATLSASALEALEGYDWPGNVRELKNALWRAALLADARPITPRDLGLFTASGRAPTQAVPVAVTLMDAERQAVADALRATGGNRRRAAEVLGIARSTLLEKIRKYGLS